MSTPDRCATFRDLHASGCILLPNAWDAGSAVVLESLGFEAIATSSAGLAFTLGRPDTPASIGLEATLANVRAVSDATRLPVNADFQAGYGATPDEVAVNVRRCIDAGAAGLSIEDATGDDDRPLFGADAALERVEAARAAIDESGTGAVLTARAEAFLVGAPAPLETALARLTAFADAGADCLFAPGLSTPAEVTAVVEAAAPKPVNVLAVDPSWMTLDALRDLGVRRISVGSALARVGWGAFLEAARDIAATGSFRRVAGAEPFESLNRLFASAE